MVQGSVLQLDSPLRARLQGRQVVGEAVSELQ